MAKSERRGIQSIEVGGRLLAALVRTGEPMMLRDLALEADLAPAQAHAYLSSFRRTELVEQDPESGKYVLGSATLRLGLGRIRTSQPLAAASVAAAELSLSLGLMVVVVVWGAYAPTAVQVNEGAQSLNINIRPGTTFNVTGSSCGRVFGAFGKTDAITARVEAEFEGVSAPGIGRQSSRGEFASELSTIRSRGYSGLIGSPVPGLTSVSAPVFGIDQQLELVLTLIGSSSALDPSPTDPSVRALLHRASTLSVQREGVRA